ncbi:MAG: hypothetical protein ACK4QW_17990, partial [Alphaproteobacteria bacterium]
MRSARACHFGIVLDRFQGCDRVGRAHELPTGKVEPHDALRYPGQSPAGQRHRLEALGHRVLVD